MTIYEQDVVMFETKENGDKVIKMPISRANNIEGIGRSANTAYVVGDVVYVDNNKKVALKCVTGGTTSSSELDVSNKAIGSSVTDGSVIWQVVNRSNVLDESDVLPIANGGTGATTKEEALANLGGLPLSGGTMTGNMQIVDRGFLGYELDSDNVVLSNNASSAIFLGGEKDSYTNEVVLRSYKPNDLSEYLDVIVSAQNRGLYIGGSLMPFEVMLHSANVYVKAKGTENNDVDFYVPDGGTWNVIIGRSIKNIPYFNVVLDVAGGTHLFSDSNCGNGFLFAWQVN